MMVRSPNNRMAGTGWRMDQADTFIGLRLSGTWRGRRKRFVRK
jgi:hypothetical protein